MKGVGSFLRAVALLSATVLPAVSPAMAQEDTASEVVVAQLGVDERSLLGEPEGPPLSGEELKTATLAIAVKLRCPICQGLSVADSPSASALAMLSQVRDLVEAGYSHDQIFDYFESTYGEFVRLQPRAEGFNLIVWIGPVVVVLAGVWLLVRRRHSQPQDDEDLSRYLDQVRSDLGTDLDSETEPGDNLQSTSEA